MLKANSSYYKAVKGWNEMIALVEKIRCDARESLGFTAVYRGFVCFVSQPDGTWKEVR